MRALILGAAFLAVTAGSGAALAQETGPATNTGPQFGAWGPGQPAPGGAQLVPSPQTGAAPQSPSGAAAPSPSGQVAAPSPTWGGCNANLSGTWSASGQQSTPNPFSYNATVSVQQYGNWVQATETQGGGQTQYYGQCNGSSLQFDVYSGGQFLGNQGGTVEAGDRWGRARASFTWATWAPAYAAGTEHWRHAY